MLVPRHATRHRFERGLVRAGSGYVHYRRAGHGPVVVALHESPRSSTSLLPLMDALADRHTVIALDTPGYGHSDPLASAAPVIADFTRALAAAVDGLGLSRFALYGTHTGAAIAAAFALEAPERVHSLVLDGLAAFTARERDDFLTRYLAPFVPQWDGTHLAALWSRVGDLYRWFPWHERTRAARLATALPPLEKVYETLEGFLLAGDGYRLGYACAATFDAGAAVAALRVPTLLLAREHDLIASHLDRVAATPSVRIARPSPAPEAWASEIRAHLALGAHEALPWTSAARREREPEAGRTLLRWGEGYLHARSAGSGEASAIMIPDLPGTGAAALQAALPHAASAGRAWAIDLPGCGASDPASHDAEPVAAALDAIGQLQQFLGGRTTVVGVGLGAALAALHEDAQVIDVPGWMTGRRPLPALAVVPAAQRDASGANFLGSWYQLRDAVFDAEPAAEAPDAAGLQRRHTALWTAPQCGALAQALQERVAADATLRARMRTLEGEST